MKTLLILLLGSLGACTASSSTRALSPDQEQAAPRHLRPDSTNKAE